MILQVRKILELVALSSLVANSKLYTKTYEDFARHYNAELILRDLERINSDFYPRPVTQSKSEQPGVDHHLVLLDELDDTYLR